MRRTAAVVTRRTATVLILSVAASLLTMPSAFTPHALANATPLANAATSANARPPAPWAVTRPEPARLDGAQLAATPQPVLRGVDLAAAQLPSASDGTVQVSVDGDARTVQARVRALGGRVLLSAGQVSSVQLPRAQLASLGTAPGVRGVHTPVRAFTDTATSQGVASSQAGTWQGPSCVGDCGAGVSVAIVDAGFGALATEQSLGNLPAATYTNEGCPTGGQTASDTQHGTAVAEIVHQMAPGAQLYLYCVADSVGFGLAAADVVNHGVSIVNSSLGFPADSRGDGSGAQTSAAIAVRNARASGVLWIQSAGNNAAEHWTGSLVDRDHDGLVDLGCDVHSGALSTCPESDAFYTAPGAAPTTAVLKWDGWPTSPITDIKLEIVGRQCAANWASCTGPARTPIIGTHAAGTEPTISLSVAGTSSYMQWIVAIKESSSHGTPFDLSYWGGVSDPSYLASIAPTKAAGQSVTEPASSPYAMAVGADNVSTGSLERFSSQGPTIDGRVKPDISGWDCVSSNLPMFAAGFCGTSAAAPHVAGAAALVRAANPSMDPAQIQTFLEQRANNGAPYNPPSDLAGHGALTLGANSGVVPPPVTKFQMITPVRVFASPAGTPLGAHGTQTIDLSSAVPADATAVAINLTGIGATAPSSLAVYPGPTWPGTSNLNLNTADRTAAVFAVVPIQSLSSRTIVVRNDVGQVRIAVDLLGYFGTGVEPDAYTATTPTRVLDTRPNHMTGTGPIGGGGTVTVQPNAPAGTDAVVVNITAADETGPGDFRISTNCSTATSTLNFTTRTRANMAIVNLDPATGTFCVYAPGAPADVIVDVLGYLSPSGGAGYLALPSPLRIMDTRTGNGAPVGPVGPGQSRTLFTAGAFGLPYFASAAMLNVTATVPSAPTYLQVYPGTVRAMPPTSTLNLSPGETVPNAAIAGVDPNTDLRQFGVYNSAGNVSVVIDLYGYFMPLS